MNSEIVFEEVEVTEEVFRGTLILDGRQTPRQQKRKIFNMMRKEAGIIVENESEYNIGYEGVEDNDGLSETQTTDFVVTRTYMKKVPFKVTREEIYKGTYVLDGLRITPEEQREQIFNLLRDEGYDIENEDEYEIGYEGADDNDGLSETQTTEYVVYHVKKERIDEEELAAFENDNNNKIPDLYNEMVEIRDELLKAKDSATLEELAEKVDSVTDRVDEIIEQKIKDYGIFEQEIESLNNQIEEQEEKVIAKAKEYGEVFEELKELSEDKSEENERKRERINDKLQSISKEQDRLKKGLSSLKGKRTKLKNDLETAKLLDLSAEEYNDLVSNLRKKGILEAIYEKKGLADIISIPAKERTREQKKQLKEAKEEIMAELAKLQNEDSSKSVLDNIEALYGIEFEKVTTNGRERILIVKPESYKNMVNNANNLPAKVKMKAKEDKVDYVPGEVPEDLKDVFPSVETEEKVVASGRVHIDDIYLRGLTEEETIARYEEAAIKDAESNGLVYNPETMSINFSGAEVDEAASDIQYQGYSIIETTTKEIEYEEVEEIVEKVVASGKVHIDDIYLRGLTEEETIARYEEEAIKDAKSNGLVYNPETMSINFSGAEVDEAASDIQYQGYSIIEKTVTKVKRPKVKPEPEEVEEITEEVIASGRVHIDDIYLRGLTEEETIARYEEEAIKDAESNGIVYDPETMSINFSGAEVDEAASDIQYQGYSIIERKVTKVKKPEIVEKPQEEVVEEKDEEKLLPAVVIEKEQQPVIEDEKEDEKQLPAVVEEKEEKPVEEEVEEKEQVVEEEKPVIDLSRDVKDKITVFVDDSTGKLYVRMPVFARFDIEPTFERIRIEGNLCSELLKDEYEEIKENMNNDYSPYFVDEVHINGIDKAETKEEVVAKVEPAVGEPDKKVEPKIIVNNEELELTRANLLDRITIFVDDSTGKMYARTPVFNRFDIDPVSDKNVIAGGTVCREISEEDYEEIRGNMTNDYSPYLVSEVHLPEVVPAYDTREEKEEFEEVEEIEERVVASGRVHIDDIYLRGLSEEETHDRYVSEAIKDAESRGLVFNPDTMSINFSGAEVDEAASDIQYQGYSIIEKNVTKVKKPVAKTEPRQLPDTLPPMRKTEPVPTPDTMPPEVIVINEPPQILYGPPKMPETGVVVVKSTEPKPVKTEPQPVKTEPQPVKTEPQPVKTEPKPRPTKPPVIVAPKKKAKPHVEEILAKLTANLDIRAKDSKRYNASNIKVAKSFKQELSSGNYLYNIVHLVPTIIKTSVNIFRKLTGSIMTSKRAREAMDTIKERLDNLSEEELEVLFNEYKGSVLKTDMNNQINSLILDRLRRYGLEKVNILNNNIEINYSELFVILGELKAIEQQLEKTTDKKKRATLEAARDKLNESAAGNIRRITEFRTEANNLLSGGVHGLEEDFKAVSTKMSYVGLRFGKSHDFDTELQQRLGAYGRNLNVALAEENNEEIVKNFMGLESCYYDNTEIRGSIVGKRSVGSKYYSPLAEQFDYRDDPFIRDLFTTVAVTTAAISAVNALRNQQILAEHNKAIAEHNEKVAEANGMNDAMAKTARDTGQGIADKRDTFREGMASQSQHDILTNANTRERAHLDSTNWQFNDEYHVIDPAGHEAYNQFGDRVTSEINAVTADYARGAITAQEALQKIEYISSNANTTLNGVINDCLPILRQYASTHPQFDLHAVEESMQYISAHPDAIANMNHAMVDVVNMGESLTTLQAAHVEALALLPPQMTASIIGAASSAALAGLVAGQLSKGPLKKNKYGNEVTDMMDEYMAEREAEGQNQRTR